MRPNIIEDICFDNKDQQQEVEETPTTNVNKSSPSCDSGICVNMNTFKEEIGRKIESLIDIKLSNKFAKNSDVLKCEMPARNTISYERGSNMVIHGMAEVTSNMSDADEVRDIFDAIDVKYEPVTIFRLGIKKDNKNRPLKVRLHSKEEKDSIFTKLGRLNHA